MTNYEQVDSFTQFSAAKMGGIDLYINNAGFAGVTKRDLISSEASSVAEMVETNLIGTLFGCKSAMKYMSTQQSPLLPLSNGKPGFGHIYLMEGRGSFGESTPNGCTYGCTKYALVQLSKSLADEMNATNVGIHRVQPGMVITGLLVSDSTPATKKIFNILAEDADIVAEYLVPNLRLSKGNRGRVAFLTYFEVVRRFATFFMRKNRFFNEQGDYVYHKKFHWTNGQLAQVYKSYISPSCFYSACFFFYNLFGTANVDLVAAVRLAEPPIKMLEMAPIKALLKSGANFLTEA